MHISTGARKSSRIKENEGGGEKDDRDEDDEGYEDD